MDTHLGNRHDDYSDNEDEDEDVEEKVTTNYCHCDALVSQCCTFQSKFLQEDRFL